MVKVEDLLQKPFHQRSLSEQVDIVLTGKPTPQLQRTVFRDANSADSFDIYSYVPWLTACETSQSFFCWPCLLFGPDTDDWCSTGFKKYKSFMEEFTKHKKGRSHLSALLRYQLFRYSNSLADDTEASTVQADEHDSENDRQSMLQAINTVLFVVSQQCAVAANPTNPPKLQVSDCINTLQFLSTVAVESLSLDGAMQFLVSSPNVLTDIASSIAKLLRETVKKEVQMSSYASLVLNEHSKVTHKSLLSTVLRYLKNGRVCERFLGFSEVNQYKTADVIYQFISRIVEEYDLSEKFAAYSIDGAVLASAYHMKPLKFRLRDDYPFSYFVPCYFHDLDILLEVRLSNLKEIKRFFDNLRALKTFFCGKPKPCRILEGFLDVALDPGLERSEWCSTRFLFFVKTHRVQLIKFFESILLNHGFWEARDLSEGVAFQQILSDFDTVFVLETFFKIFSHTSELRTSLMSPSFESAIDKNMVDTLKAALDKDRQFEAFEAFWLSVVSEMLGGQTDTKNLSLQKAMENEKKMMFREFYIKIFDLLIEEIGERFESLTDLLFFHVFDTERYEESVVREVRDERVTAIVCAETPLESLFLVHGPCFESTWVENELKVFFKNLSCFPSNSVYDLLEFFGSADLKKTFRNLTQIAELILALPCKPPSPTYKGPSKLKCIKTWASLWENKEVFSDLSLLCIENEFLKELQEQSEFLDNIVLKYQECENQRKNTTLVIDVQML